MGKSIFLILSASFAAFVGINAAVTFTASMHAVKVAFHVAGVH
jgi:hypothetical protein